MAPKVPKNMAMATSLTKGEVIKKENVTPNGMPPFTKPMNNGTDEQEQNGVMAPKSDANTYCNPNNLCEFRKLRRRSMGK